MTLPTTATQAEKNAHYRDVFRRYVDMIAAEDLEGVLALFADDAEIQDPVGSERVFRGRDEIRGFYERVMAAHARLRITGPCTGSFANVATMPIEASTAGLATNVVSVATFDDHGLIVRYHAHWGPGDWPGDVPMPGEGIIT